MTSTIQRGMNLKSQIKRTFSCAMNLKRRIVLQPYFLRKMSVYIFADSRVYNAIFYYYHCH